MARGPWVTIVTAGDADMKEHVWKLNTLQGSTVETRLTNSAVQALAAAKTSDQARVRG